MNFATTQKMPDDKGYFGRFGGRFVPETLMEALIDLEKDYISIWNSPEFHLKFQSELRSFAGRPTPLYFAKRLTEELGAGDIYLKREDLLHTGAHKINNCIGQALLAEFIGKKRIVAETGAGQHGVATAAVCARYGLECIVYMGSKDIDRQAANVNRMKQFGAEVREVKQGSRTLKDAINEALRDWTTNVETTHYLIGSVVGPHPYPLMVRNFQRVIGEEVRTQLQEIKKEAAVLIACVGGGSNCIGMFHPFLQSTVQLIGVEAAGEKGEASKNSATLTYGHPGILHGAFTYILQREQGQIEDTESIAPGLDYAAVGPEHSFLKDSGRVKYVMVSDEEALQACAQLARLEGILPALESSHALAYLKKQETVRGAIVVNLSGRGDKDLGLLEKGIA